VIAPAARQMNGRLCCCSSGHLLFAWPTSSLSSAGSTNMRIAQLDNQRAGVSGLTQQLCHAKAPEDNLIGRLYDTGFPTVFVSEPEKMCAIAGKAQRAQRVDTPCSCVASSRHQISLDMS
jgi:hypothetical protein